jgi:hypothetical protein
MQAGQVFLQVAKLLPLILGSMAQELVWGTASYPDDLIARLQQITVPVVILEQPITESIT